MTRRGALHLPVNTLALRRGGLVKAVMLRANALAANEERDVVIEVLAFQPRLEEDIADLVSRGFLDARVHVRSILRCLDPSAPGPTAADPVRGCVHHGVPFGSAPRVGRPAIGVGADPRAAVLGEPPRPLIDRAVRAGWTHREPTADGGGRPRYVETFDRRGALVRREELGSADRIVRVLDYRPGENRAAAHRWMGRDGRCFLAVWPTTGGRDWGMAFAAVDGFQALPDPKALYRLAFEHALRDEIDPVLFSEFREGLPNIPGRGFDDVVLAVRHPSLRRVAVVHSNHALQGEREVPLRSSPNFTALLTGLPKWDLLVTATEQQRDEIAEQYGSPERLAAIPHYGPEPSADEHADYDSRRFVLVARIHRKKRVDEAIEAFRLVVNEVPDARLEVYGFGYGDELEARITQLVEDLGLTANVEFRGFVEDVRTIYAGACASLQTSESEGFGMALLESLAAGVPVVAYDVSYGAREAIRDGVDGFVVPWGDRAAMARRLVELSTDRALRARLAAEAPTGASRFSRERYVREWEAALAALPVRTELDTAVRAQITKGGEVRLSSPFAGAVVLRMRGRGEEIAAELSGGTATATLPQAGTGDILDVFVRGGGKEHRAAFGGGESEDPTWRAYATEYGNLSLKRIPAKSAVDSAGGSNTVAGRVARRLRRGRGGSVMSVPARARSVLTRMLAVVAVLLGLTIGLAGNAEASSAHPYSNPVWWPVNDPGMKMGCYHYNPGCPTQHSNYAMDVAAPNDSSIPVYAMGAGIAHVVTTNWTCAQGAGRGNWLYIDHANGTTSEYGHLGTIFVKSGQLVTPQTKLAVIWRSGYGPACTNSALNYVRYLWLGIRHGTTYFHFTTSYTCLSGNRVTWPTTMSTYPTTDWNLVPAKTDIPASDRTCIPAEPATPTKPTAISLVKSAAGALKATWAHALSTDHVTVINVQLQRYSPTKAAWLDVTNRRLSGGYTSTTFTSLVHGSYRFRVWMANSVGWSAPSYWISRTLT